MPETPRLVLFPETALVNAENHLVLGGCDCTALAAQYGTPLYLFDEVTLRRQCARFRTEFSRRYANTLIIYACKAYINPALARLFLEEGLGLDVVSGGEMAVAQVANFTPEKVFFHGNNKGAAELAEALAWGVGRVVVDNFHELALLQSLAEKAGKVQSILLRLSPGVDPHTHAHTTTGILDSKFGFPLVTGQAEQALVQALKSAYLRLTGLHVHLGSPIFELGPYQKAIELTLEFAAQMKKKHGWVMEDFSPGGGFAIQYVQESPPPLVADYAEAIVSALLSGCEAHGLNLPRLIIEPGRALVGRAGVALYTVGAAKDIPGLRKYVSLDGGMADNIRPAIYGSRYEALVANRVVADRQEKVTLAGKFCESGDILIRDIELPVLRAGDLVAIPASGAYCLSMASNYNASLKPPILLVKEGKARLIRRRETYEDLMRCDLF